VQIDSNRSKEVGNVLGTTLGRSGGWRRPILLISCIYVASVPASIRSVGNVSGGIGAVQPFTLAIGCESPAMVATQQHTGSTCATSVVCSGHSSQMSRSQAPAYTRQPGTYQDGGGVDDGFI
jgi:hypothetical protein